MKNQVICGDCKEVLRRFPPNTFDTIITDPPYGLGFMGKEWDHGIPGPVFWQICLRVAKPGAMMLVFGGTRTFHRLACVIEDAGWEIRDCMMYLYGSGFPKSLDISKAIDKAVGAKREVVGEKKAGMGSGKTFGMLQSEGHNSEAPTTVPITIPATELAKLWDGWGAALKPAWEPIIIAMKPLDGTFAHNAETWGVAGLNVDGGRIETNAGWSYPNGRGGRGCFDKESLSQNLTEPKQSTQGRWPANLLLDEESAEMLDKQSGITKSPKTYKRKSDGYSTGNSGIKNIGEPKGKMSLNFGDSGGASRFFYCAKAGKKERNKGCDNWMIFKWIDPNNEENMAVVELLQKVTFGLTVKWNIGESGKNIMVLCPKDFLSTTLMEIKKIIGSKIFAWLQHCGTNDITEDVEKSVENGGNLAGNVENLNQWPLITTEEKMGLAPGVKRVASEMLLKISKRENWQQFTNFHPTCKPLALMEYLCKLTKTPTGGLVLDPFGGSGTTALACINTGRDYILIEKEPEYCEIANKRIGGLNNGGVNAVESSN